MPQPISFEGALHGSWTNSIPFGTTNADYVEDCYFDNPGLTGKWVL